MKRAFCLAAFAVVGSASATTLTFTGLADDFFEAYHSTNDSIQGTQFVAQTGTWQGGAQTGSIALVANVTNYLHIRARDAFGAPSMFIGVASLSDNAFQFDNLSNVLVTNTANWKLSLSGFGSNYVTPADLGANGTGAWGFNAGIPSNARRIWSTTAGGGGEHYFSVRINAVPEPATLAALAAGIGVMIRKRKR